MTENTNEEIKKEQVLDFLKKNPEVFLSADFISNIIPKRNFKSSNIHDLQKFVIEKLNIRFSELAEANDEILSITKFNMEILKKTLQSVIEILHTYNLKSLDYLLSRNINSQLGVDKIILGIEVNNNNKETYIKYDFESLKVYNRDEINEIISPKTPVLMFSKTKSKVWAIPTREKKIISEAIVRLEKLSGMPNGFFAMGSKTEGYFSENQETDLLVFLAKIVHYSAGRWWNDNT